MKKVLLTLSLAFALSNAQNTDPKTQLEYDVRKAGNTYSFSKVFSVLGIVFVSNADSKEDASFIFGIGFLGVGLVTDLMADRYLANAGKEKSKPTQQ